MFERNTYIHICISMQNEISFFVKWKTIQNRKWQNKNKKNRIWNGSGNERWKENKALDLMAENIKNKKRKQERHRKV